MKHKKSLKAIQRIVTHRRQNLRSTHVSLGVLGMLHLSYLLFLKRLLSQAQVVAQANGRRSIIAEDIYEVSEAVLKESAG